MSPLARIYAEPAAGHSFRAVLTRRVHACGHIQDAVMDDACKRRVDGERESAGSGDGLEVDLEDPALAVGDREEIAEAILLVYGGPKNAETIRRESHRPHGIHGLGVEGLDLVLTTRGLACVGGYVCMWRASN